MKKIYSQLRIVWVLYFLPSLFCSDMTHIAFGTNTKIIPAAFGDFNSDELTDLFVISSDQTMVEILLGSTKEPYFFKSENLNCSVPSGYIITSVVPGDFDGDSFMDVLITSTLKSTSITHVFVYYGYLSNSTGQYDLICSDKYVIEMIDEPLAIITDKNMSINLFGRNKSDNNVFWKFNKNRTKTPDEKPLNMTGAPVNFKMKLPHSHAFLDLNKDNSPDLFLTGTTGYGIWLYNPIKEEFIFNNIINYPRNFSSEHIGQSLFIDLETADNMYPIVPVCEDSNKYCLQSAIYVYADNQWFNLKVNFNDKSNKTWGFVPPDGRSYTDTITLRAGDFNNDGYVDLLATLRLVQANNKVATFLLENVACTNQNNGVKRTFEIKWDALAGANENAVMGTFYDFMQDGILDIIFVKPISGKNYSVSAFKNSLDYDANFIKVMVIAGLKNKESEILPTLLGQKRTFGTNLPGPKIQYRTTTQDGNVQTGVAAQLPQSAHFALYLPYTIFGLGRTPNFVEDLTVGIFNESKTWTQLIPNSQLVVIPYPPNAPNKWRAQLFVTPSKVILQTVIALAGTCVVIAFIIALLHWKERREDRIERLQGAHRFHFDAM